jgi:hypothetical protein
MIHPGRSLFALICAVNASFASSQSLDNSGTLFYLGFMRNYNGNPSQYLELSIASEFTTSGSVSCTAMGYYAPFTVVPGLVTSIIVPQSFMHMSSEVVEDLGLKVESVAPITVQALNFESYTADGTSILPHPMLGTDHLVLAYQGLSGFTDLLSELLVVATADGTEVEITPTVNTLGGHPANVTFTVTLDEGQSYQVQAAVAEDDLTGSRVHVVTGLNPCTPVAVFSGSVCTDVPVGCFACDHLFEQDLPLSAWGTQFQTVPFEGATIYDLRFQAGADAAVVTVGSVPYAVSAWGHFDLPSQIGPLCISADVPICVAQYMDGVTCSGYGDPAMVILGSEDQGVTHATFSTITSTVITDHYFSLVTESANAGQISLNGVLIPAASYTTYPICPDRVYYSSVISPGTWVLDAPLPFNATLYGMGSAESYATSLGAVLPPTIYTSDTVICWAGGPITLDAPGTYVDPWWSSVDAPDDTLAVGAQYSFTPFDGQQVVVNDGENPDPCFGTATIYNIELLQPFTVSATASADTSCAFAPFDVLAVASPLLPGMEYQWSPATSVDDAAAPITSATLFEDGWLTVTASSSGGCSTALDSVFIDVITSDLMSLDATANDSTLCLGNTTQLFASIGQVVGIDAFNGSLGPIWNSVTGGAVAAGCGSGGTALVFDGNPARRATTDPLDVSNGGTVHFDLMISDGSFCDNAEPGDDVELQYSPNFGGIWYALATFNEAAYPALAPVGVQLPAAAQTTNTMFRWQQVGTYTAGEDIWMIDNVVIEAISATGMDVVWSPGAGLDDPLIADPLATPPVTTDYIVTVTDPLSGCSRSDTITIEVADLFTVVAAVDTILCYPNWAPLYAMVNDTTGVTYVWEEVGTADCTIMNAYSPLASVNCVPTTASIVVTATSPTGCTATDTVYVEVLPQPPVPVITPIGSDLYTSSGWLDYQWFLDGSPIIGANDDHITPTVTGAYTVMITDVNGCTNISDPYDLVIDLIGEVAGTPFIVAYDAATGSLVIEAQAAIEG